MAERFTTAGLRILLVDDPSKSRCSRVAAGLINPIGGKRLKLVWQADSLIPHARAYYDELSSKLGQKLFHPRPIHRYFANEQEAQLWRKRKEDPAHQQWVGFSADDHFTIPDSGYLDTNALLDLIHAQLESHRQFLSSTFNYDEIALTETGIAFRDYKADYAIFAEGHLATSNPHFSFIPYKPAKGIIASIKPAGASLPLDQHILLKGKFIIPRHDGTIQVGATYNWNDPTDIPDAAGIQELAAFLDQELGSGTWEFEQIRAGVRPATAGAYPVVGPHPKHPQLIAFNGFGSKGSLQIPYFAEALIAFLEVAAAVPADKEQASLHTEVLPSRFIKKAASKPKRWIATNVVKSEILGALSKGDLAIDATAGNGHDTQWLAEAVGPAGHVFAYDIQEQALAITRERLEKHQLLSQATLLQNGHETLLGTIPQQHHGQITAIVFNLGFLPGGVPTLITKSDTTIRALKASLTLLKPGGTLAVTLYPTHTGAQEEVDLVLSWFHNLPENQFETHIEPHPQNNPSSPYPIFIKRR
ncbi:FAD-dependent oxidoreductase [Pelagicoccus enzymogenes]|nr:FAD-dependent oxidoreductase [Pelagicoccus enzymogenes]